MLLKGTLGRHRLSFILLSNWSSVRPTPAVTISEELEAGLLEEEDKQEAGWPLQTLPKLGELVSIAEKKATLHETAQGKDEIGST